MRVAQPEAGSSNGSSPDARFTGVLLLLFVGSGCAALIYEIVWFQLLQQVIGSSAISLGLLLAAFMGGMCIGSLALSRLVPIRRHPLVVYALLECAIGALGILVLFAMPWVGRLYVANVGQGLPGLLLRGVICAACLLPPTVLMGATLPAVGRWVESTPRGMASLGLFYGGNILGAVVGCLLAGFYLLRLHDVWVAAFVAAGINGVVAVVGLTLAKRAGYSFGLQELSVSETVTRGALAVYLVVAISGFCALGAEVVWTRQLSMLFGGTVYAFSIILAVFLAGLGIGSTVAASNARRAPRPRLRLAVCQFLLVAAIAWGAFSLAVWLPEWTADFRRSEAPGAGFVFDLVRASAAMLPATILWGASFPLALAALAGVNPDAGRLAGRLYAANTLGAIAGAVAFSLIAIATIGTRDAQRVLMGFALLASLIALGAASTVVPESLRNARLSPCPLWICRGGMVCLAACLLSLVPSLPGKVFAYGRHAARLREPELIYVGEGVNSSVAVSRTDEGAIQFHVNGKVEASTAPQDMRLQRMLGHLPALAHPDPRSVLIVGCGAGVTAGCFVQYPGIERIVICEIERLIPTRATPHFALANNNVLNDPRVEVVIDDARHYLLTTQENFDIITADPLDPWAKGVASLYTIEHFQQVRRCLNPGGLVSQFVQLYESDLESARCEIGTFAEVFPDVSIWGNEFGGRGYDLVLLGGSGPVEIRLKEIHQKLQEPSYAGVAADLSAVELRSAFDLVSTYAGQAADLTAWLRGATLNRERNLRLQYIAGLAMDRQDSASIYADLLKHRRYPTGWLVVSDEEKARLETQWKTETR